MDSNQLYGIVFFITTFSFVRVGGLPSVTKAWDVRGVRESEGEVIVIIRIIDNNFNEKMFFKNSNNGLLFFIEPGSLQGERF